MNRPFFIIEMLDDAKSFLESLEMSVQREILQDLKYSTQHIKTKFFKKLAGTDIWEFRSNVKGLQYRFLAFWDKKKKSMVIATHGFVKKTQKTPPGEIEKAIKIMKKYYQQ